MPGFANIAEYAQADLAGRSRFCSFRKAPANSTTTRWWQDFSMMPGNPPPNYYAASPLVAKTLDGFDGIFHGSDVAPASLHISTFGLMTPTAQAASSRYILCDYLLYYPFIDGDETGPQFMTNTVTLPRYTTGADLKVMAVALAPSIGGGLFTFTYINQDGVEKTSPTQRCSAGIAPTGALPTSEPGFVGSGGPFLMLADGDTGLRSITSIQFSVTNGGLIALVIVKPLLDMPVREANTAVEWVSVVNRVPAPRVLDGAYLHLIGDCSGSIGGGFLTGYATFMWSDD